jgi:hypothetical protein
MNYELVAKLKDAGYPQTAPRTAQFLRGVKCEGLNDYAIVPTLEELIEACGDDFKDLMKDGERWFCPPWRKQGFSTPTEAVARLWLALRATA